MWVRTILLVFIVVEGIGLIVFGWLTFRGKKFNMGYAIVAAMFAALLVCSSFTLRAVNRTEEEVNDEETLPVSLLRPQAQVLCVYTVSALQASNTRTTS